MIIGVDVDNTFLASDKCWWEWLKHIYKRHTYSSLDDATVFGGYGNVKYNLAKYFTDKFDDSKCPLDYFRREGVYDTVPPVEGAVEYVNKLIDEGHTINFITHNMGLGGKSKYDRIHFLLGHKNFNYFVTKEKQYVKCDVLVDDRNNFLNIMDPKECQAIRISTRYEQFEKLNEGIPTFKNWEGIYHFIQQISD